MKVLSGNLTLLIVALATFSAFAPGPVMNSPVDNVIAEEALGGAYLVFAGKMGGDISKTELRGQKELGVDGCARGSRIFAFTLEIYNDGKTRKLEGKSNVLTKEMISALTSLDVGESFEFKSMKAYLPNGKDVVDVHGQKFVVV